MMSARRIGAAVVIDAEHAGIGILTERDILDSVAAGEDPDAELAAQHRTEDLTYASPDWTLEQAAAAMIKGGFRHLVVVEGHDVAGLLSMRDIVRCWTSAEAAGRSRWPRPHEPASQETAGSRVWVTNGGLPEWRTLRTWTAKVRKPICGCWPRPRCADHWRLPPSPGRRARAG